MQNDLKKSAGPTMEEISSEIIKSCQNGGAADFARIVECYHRRIFAFIYRLDTRLIGCEPEDLVQEAFLKIYQNIGSYQAARGAKFSTWIFAIVRNLYLDQLRKSRGEQSRDAFDEDKIACEPDTRAQSPSEAFAQKETAAQIRDAVARLPEDMRSAFILKYYEDLPYEEIAAILDCKTGTAKSRVARAKQILSGRLQGLKVNIRRGG